MPLLPTVTDIINPEADHRWTCENPNEKGWAGGVLQQPLCRYTPLDGLMDVLVRTIRHRDRVRGNTTCAMSADELSH